MRKWSILFAMAAIGTVGCTVYSYFDPDWWLPNTARDMHRVVSTFGREIDNLFLIILFVTGGVFIITQVVLVAAMYRFPDRRDDQGRPVRKAVYSHGSQLLELIWTIIPAGILVFIALYQMGTWASIKYRGSAPRVPPLAEITARQFQWVMRYPGPDRKLNTADDLVVIDDLHFVKKQSVLIYLKSADVLHSFYLPQLRIKQDAVPGLTIPVWFDCDEAGEYELVCAELCGWGHYKMRSNVTVHETEEDLRRWIDEKLAEQGRSQLAMAPGSGSEGGNRND